MVTNAKGLASTTLQLPATVATVTVTASSVGFKNVNIVEYSVAPSAITTGVNPAVFTETGQ
jgi:hypothetical protein